MSLLKMRQSLLNHTEKLAVAWVAEVRKTEYMKTYNSSFSDQNLIKKTMKVYECLAEWLEEGASKDKIGLFFSLIGAERYVEGFPLCEIEFGHLLSKKIIYHYLMSENFLDNTCAVYNAFEFTREVYNFFDLGVFYLTRGYLEKQYSEMKADGLHNLQKYFFDGSFFLDHEIPLNHIFSVNCKEKYWNLDSEL